MRYLSNFWCNIIFKRSAIFFFHQQDSKSLFLRKRWSRDLLVHVAYGTSANRVISLLHTRRILYSLCLPVHHFSQLSVNLTSFLRTSENIFQIWSKSVGYAKLLGRLEPIRKGTRCKRIIIKIICPNISEFLLLHKGTVLVSSYAANRLQIPLVIDIWPIR